jgi:rubrerythrin
MLKELTLRKAIELAVVTEQMGADFYDRLKNKFSGQKDLADIFDQLVRDERKHETQFKTILESVPEQDIESGQFEKFQYLRATAISSFFRKDGLRDTDEIKTADDALGKALAFEKATLQYYEAIRDLLGEQPQLKQIIDAERSHVVALMKVIVADAKFRGLDYEW